MIRNILNQQREERDFLISNSYLERINLVNTKDFLQSKLIKLITGPRRSGKSVFSLQLLKGLNFAYLNFDDDLLLKNFDENKVVQLLSEIYPHYTYLLLDEIQNLPKWELWVNKLYRRGINMVITGSNAKLLSHEMGTFLTGRFLQIELYPFSFKEFYRIFHSEKSTIVELTPVKKAEVLSKLNDYLQYGGYPESVYSRSITKNYLSTLLDSILLKDIAKRFHIRQTQELYDLSHYLLSNYGNLFSYNLLKNDLKLNSVATVQKFCNYLSEPYLFFYLTCYSFKIKLQQKTAKKPYIIDNGFITSCSFSHSADYGRLLENLVFIELLRNGYKPEKDLFYFKTRTNKEIDFLCKKGNEIKQLIQVCYDISSSKTLKREQSALLAASEELKCSNLIILTWDHEQTIELLNKKIQVIPVWKWILK